jgi:uncharacterized protein (TIGR02996 family)
MGSANESLPAFFLRDDPRAVLSAAASVASLSSGQVRSAETINRRTGKPARDGIFCAKIFGPVEDHRCLCGKLSTREAAGQACDRCGVLCGEKGLRGERWGHIESPVPLVHPRLVPLIAEALGCGEAELIEIVGSIGDGPRGDEAKAERGPAMVAARLGTQADGLMVSLVPVVPPDWRGTRGDPQDAAYLALVNRCYRLRRLGELNAPQIILDNEACLTQKAFERLCRASRQELAARGPVVSAPVTERSTELLHAVYEAPDDDAPRRAYAAHLAAQGDPRGEFITRQLDGATRRQMTKPEADLLRRNFDRFIAPLGDVVEPKVAFRRGFLASCKAVGPNAAARADDPAWATVEHLETDRVELAASPALRGLRSLALPYQALRALCEGGTILPQVEALQVTLSHCPPPHAEAVTCGDALPGLHDLALSCRSVRGARDWAWLDGTILARRLRRLDLALAAEAVGSLSLPWWVDFVRRHRGLPRVTFSFGSRSLSFELRHDGDRVELQIVMSRSTVEQIAMGYAEVAEQLVKALTAVDPSSLSVQIKSAGEWFGDDLAALARTLRGHFGTNLWLPAVGGE